MKEQYARDWAHLAQMGSLLQVAEKLSATFYPEDCPANEGEQWCSAAEMVEMLSPIVKEARAALERIREELRTLDRADSRRAQGSL